MQTLYDRILGRTALNDVIHPLTGEVICKAGEEITESIAEAIEKSPLESVEIRSVLTCEARRGVCAKWLRAATLPLPAWCRRAKWSA